MFFENGRKPKNPEETYLCKICTEKPWEKSHLRDIKDVLNGKLKKNQLFILRDFITELQLFSNYTENNDSFIIIVKLKKWTKINHGK